MVFILKTQAYCYNYYNDYYVEKKQVVAETEKHNWSRKQTGLSSEAFVQDLPTVRRVKACLR